MAANIISDLWVALSIGNTHYYWAIFQGQNLIQAWKEVNQASTNPQQLPSQTIDFSPNANAAQWPELWLASVVPQETEKWLNYPHLHVLNLADIPLKNGYATLGLDRALGAWGAGLNYGWPMLLIDGGTALTLTGIDADHHFQGGAILPGLGLMTNSLETQTAALKNLSFDWQLLPSRWGYDTPSSIQSGIFWTVISGLDVFIQDWLKQYPQSQIIFTGGDGAALKSGLLSIQPTDHHFPCHLDQQVIFAGMAAIRQKLMPPTAME